MIGHSLKNIEACISLLNISLENKKLNGTGKTIKVITTNPINSGGMRIRTAHQLLQAFDTIAASFDQFTFPMLVLHGTADRLAAKEGSIRLHERAPSTDKALVLLEGLYHEIFHEPEKEKILSDIVHWMNERI